MSVFATLAKARLNIESIKDSYLVAVRHMIDQLSRLWSYP
jgi:hypothetical protein